MKNNNPFNASVLLAFFVLAMVALIFALILWFKPSSNGQSNSPSNNLAINNDNNSSITLETSAIDESQVLSTEQVSVTPNNQPLKTGLEQLPHSLQGTRVDGEIIIDENQQLVVTYGLRQLFDYFLSAMGEESEEKIHARVEAYIRSHAPEPAASQALNIYQNYVAYLKSLEGLENEFGSLQMQITQSGQFDSNLIKQRKSKLEKIRLQFFHQETIEAFFNAEDGLENYALAMIEIENDSSMTPEQKQSAKLNFISQMPKNNENLVFQKYAEQQANISQLIQRTEALKQQGASAEKLYQMRVQLVGVAAAKRLAQVDQEEAEFEQRFVQYQADKQAITAEFGNTADSAERIAKLETKLFSANEIRRLAGYEMVREAKKKSLQQKAKTISP